MMKSLEQTLKVARRQKAKSIKLRVGIDGESYTAIE